MHVLCAIALALPLTALALPAQAAQTKSQLTMLINERGSVEVVDRWSGMLQADGSFDYFTAAREVGNIPVTVRDGGFTISYKTHSYLRYEEGFYYFVTPDLYYPQGPLDVELSLTYPPNLALVESKPEPSYSGEGVLHWSLAEVSHQVVIAKFERQGPFVDPQRSGADYQVDPQTLAVLGADELPHSGDEVLKELENVIKLARASQSTDPDFIKVLTKLLAKFYYILDSNGLLSDYKPPREDKAGSGGVQPPK